MQIIAKKNPNTDAPTKEEWGQNGFEDRTSSTISFVDGTRTFSIQPVSTSFEYWVSGKKYTSTGDTYQITDTEGIWVFYYDDDVLTAVNNPNGGQVDSVIRTKAIVCILYWNATDNEAIYVGEERHGKDMSPTVHAYLHFVFGCKYNSGLSLNNIDADQTGNLNAHAQFGVDAGTVLDEDIYHIISSIASTVGLPIYYMLGSSPRWVRTINAGFSVRTLDNTSNTRLAFNEYTGGAWQLTEITSNDYVLCHIFATTEKDNPMIAIMGQADYLSQRAARQGALTEIHDLLLDDILFPEITAIATVIFQTGALKTNDVKAEIVTTDDGDDYIDWRNEVISRTEIPSGTDTHAIHDNESGEIAGIAHKTTPHLNDLVLIEDSEDNYSKKYITISELLGTT